jgi:hypothetical protein
MRAVIAALTLAILLAACGDSTPTFGEGGWDGGDVQEAVPLGDEPAPRPPPPIERPPQKAEPEESDSEETREAVEIPAITPEPVVIAPTTPPPVEPLAPPAPADDKPPEA